MTPVISISSIPVFHGPPSEVKTGGWPVQVNPSAPTALTGPVYDSVTGDVLVVDIGGFLYRVNSSTTAVTASTQLDVSNADDPGPGIVQGPILDYTANLVYVFATSDGQADCAGGVDCSAVWAASAAFASGETPVHAKVGISTAHGTAPSPMYIGAFDSTYQKSANATGNLYVCGNTGGNPTLYQSPPHSWSFRHREPVDDPCHRDHTVLSNNPYRECQCNSPNRVALRKRSCKQDIGGVRRGRMHR